MKWNKTNADTNHRWVERKIYLGISAPTDLWGKELLKINISKDDTENRERFWKLPKKSRFKKRFIEEWRFQCIQLKGWNHNTSSNLRQILFKKSLWKNRFSNHRNCSQLLLQRIPIKIISICYLHFLKEIKIWNTIYRYRWNKLGQSI